MKKYSHLLLGLLDTNLHHGDFPFSACVIFMNGLGENLITRAQNDNGNCSQTFND